MQLHELKPIHTGKSKKRVGRGGHKGTYSGKGMKGQTSRAGRKRVPLIRELIKKYPKLRGYRAYAMPKNIEIVNIGVLDKVAKDGDVINAENLLKMGLVGMIKGKQPQIKILGTGAISKKLIIENCKVSKSAKEAIEKAGGSIK